ncbi:MAG: topoisomerase C-terminal repeat-containing protein [Clostridia bacterium]|nr:topoisomerase C-terminal repeat-containing protein [Clostridia bacterium]
MKLIIAEKPSLGKNIANALGARERGDGYLSGNGYLVTWAFGHLFSLSDPEEYASFGTRSDGQPPETVKTTKKGKPVWRMEDLPFFPHPFSFELRKDSTPRSGGKKGNKDSSSGGSYASGGIKKQFKTIRSLCLRDDVDCIVNAGDADREGEIIIRLILDHVFSKEKKPVLRLWLPDQTEETINEAARTMQEDSAFDNLANEGMARTCIDWLYGINLSRYATLKSGHFLRVGRVIVPIVRAIYDRDMEIRAFRPTKYYSVVSSEKTKNETVELTSSKRFSGEERDAAEALCSEYNEGTATVESVKKKQEKLFPDKLFSLSKLQSFLGKRFKMPMEKSLSVLQTLYEAGYVTYPRTNSEYLAEAEKDKIRGVLRTLGEKGYQVRFKDSKAIFDDKKIESHSAITPTKKIPNPTALTEDQALVYKTVLRRFVAVFCAQDCITEKTELKVRLEKDGDVLETFTLRGTVISEPGWTRYEEPARRFKTLPALSEGETVSIHFQPVERETEPPSHYTIETLNQFLKNPFREEMKGKGTAASNPDTPDPDSVGSSDEAEYRAIMEGTEIGTEATRTGIIGNAISSGYIQLKKDSYLILPEGEYFVQTLEKLQIALDKTKTVALGQSLKHVYHGDLSVDDCVARAEEEIRSIFALGASIQMEKKAYQPKAPKKGAKKETVGPGGVSLGVCPICGSDVVRGKTAYGCLGYKHGCGFRTGIRICSREITPEEISLLLKEGKTPLLKGFVSTRTGKPFDAYLVLNNGRAVFDFENRGTHETDNSADRPEPPSGGSVPDSV